MAQIELQHVLEMGSQVEIQRQFHIQDDEILKHYGWRHISLYMCCHPLLPDLIPAAAVAAFTPTNYMCAHNKFMHTWKFDPSSHRSY